MMIVKQIKIALCFLFLLTGCDKKNDEPGSGETETDYGIRVTTSSFQQEGTTSGVDVIWKAGDTVELFEVGTNNSLQNRVTYSVLSSSISADGKSAEFYGTPLGIGKKHKAFRGSIVNYGTEFRASTNSTTGEGLLLSSAVETIPKNKQANFVLKHEMSLVELTVQMEDEFEPAELVVTSLRFSSPESAFVTAVKLGGDTCSPYVEHESDKKNELIYTIDKTYLNKNTPATIHIPVYWNEEVAQLSGNFKVTLFTQEGTNPQVTLPATVLLPGNLYRYAVTVKKEVVEDNRYVSTDYSKDGELMQLQSATKGSGVDIIIMGDGFVDRDMAAGGKYESRMAESFQYLFSIEPMKSLRAYYNVYAVKVVSKHDGVQGTNETALDTYFGDGTEVGGEDKTVFEYARKKQGLDLTKAQIMVVVNSANYAGTCWTYSNGASIAFLPYINNNSDSFSQVVHHEVVGHGIGKLLDEYIYYNGTISAQYITEFTSNKNVFGMGYNLTLDPEDAPWKHFIGHANYSMVGLYEGGYFFAKGVWRAEANSCMNNNVPYFNGPSREEIIRRTQTKAGITFTWNEFLQLDKYEPVSTSRSAWQEAQHKPFAPPVFKEWVFAE